MTIEEIKQDLLDQNWILFRLKWHKDIVTADIRSQDDLETGVTGDGYTVEGAVKAAKITAGLTVD